MPSPWFELLCLHGYITNHDLLRRMVQVPSATLQSECDEQDNRATGTMEGAVMSLRLCLGIGDGMARTQ